MAAVAAEYGWLLLAAGWTLLAMQAGWAFGIWHYRTTRGDRPDQMAAGDDMAPADGAGANRGRCVADSAALSSAPAPTGPVASRAGGGNPDCDCDLWNLAAALAPDTLPPIVPGLSADDAVGRTVMAAIDLLAASLMASDEGDEDTARECEDRCRHLLADDLTPADVIEVLMEELICSAVDRARALRAEADALDPAAIGGAL